MQIKPVARAAFDNPRATFYPETNPLDEAAMPKDFLRNAPAETLVAHFAGPEGEALLYAALNRRGAQIELILASDRLLHVEPDLADRLFAHALLCQRSYHAATKALAELLPHRREVDILACATAHRMTGEVQKARALLDAHTPKDFSSGWWLEAARLALLTGDIEGAINHVRRIEDAQGGPSKPDLDWLRGYLNALQPGAGLPCNAVSRKLADRLANAPTAGNRLRLAVLDYKTPEPGSSSMNIGDWMQTVALMRHLTRHFPDLTADHPDLTLAPLRDSWDPAQRITDAPPAHLALMDRDFPEMIAHSHPDQPVVALLHGWFLHQTFGQVRALPLPAQVTPVILSFYLQRPEDLTPRTLTFLRANAPIGCRDWPTAYWLLNKGVDAFFSGCVTTTMDLPVEGHSDEDIHVDADGPDMIEQNAPVYRRMDFAEAVTTCLDLLTRYKRARTVTTSRLHCYLPARGIGARVEFVPKNDTDRRFDGLIHDAELDFDAIRARMTGLIDTVLDAVRGGIDRDALRDLWAQTTAPLVQEARKRLAEAPPLRAPARPELRSPATDRVSVAIALDPGFAGKAGPFLRSLRANSSAAIDVYTLTRRIDTDGFAKLQAEEPALTLHHLPMEGHYTDFDTALDSGEAQTISTMDRLFLPDLLPDLDRLTYLDIDTAVLGDVAELHAMPVSASGIAARATPNNNLSLLTHWMERAITQRGYDRAKAQDLRRRIAAHGDITAPYLNAGVLVLSLDRLRALRFTETTLALVEAYGFEDQEAINMFLQGDFAEIGPEWNAQPYHDHVGMPKLIHWVGARKPWVNRPIRLAEHWRQHLQR